MDKQRLKRLAAILLLLMLIGTFTAGIVFAFLGNTPAALGFIGFNVFFSVMLFFLMRFNRYVKD